MKKRHSTEQIVAKLHQADVDMDKGLTVPEVCKQLGISEQAYYLWRTKYGGMDPLMAKQLNDLEKKNSLSSFLATTPTLRSLETGPHTRPSATPRRRNRKNVMWEI